jgi:hypothetical protein
MPLKDVIPIFLTNPRTWRLVKNWWRNKAITYRSPAPSFLKNPQLNCKTKAGHIYKVKHPPKSWNSQLSNKPKNMKIGEELVEK